MRAGLSEKNQAANRREKRIPRAVFALTICLLLALAAPQVFSAVHAGHAHHADEPCQFCAFLIHSANRQAFNAQVFFLNALALLLFALAALPAARCGRWHPNGITLVSQKIKMNN